MRNRLDDQAIVRLTLDRGELGGAVLDVDILDRALGRRHQGLQIHNLYFSATDHRPRTQSVGTSAIHWHPIPYDKSTMEADQARLVTRLRESFVRIVDAHRPSLFVNHVPENPS